MINISMLVTSISCVCNCYIRRQDMFPLRRAYSGSCSMGPGNKIGTMFWLAKHLHLPIAAMAGHLSHKYFEATSLTVLGSTCYRNV